MRKKINFILIIFLIMGIFQFCNKQAASVRLFVDNTIDVKSDGWNLLKTGKIEKAKDYFNEIEDEYEKNLGLGYVYLKLNKLKKAEKFFKTGLNIKESFILYSGLAQTEERIGNKIKSLVYYRKALTFYDDSYIQAKINALEGELSQNLILKIDKEEKNSERREKLIRKLLVVSSNAEKYRIELIGYLFYKGNYRDVINYYNGLIINGSKPDEKTRLYYAKSLYKRGLYKSALTEIEELYKDYPDDQEYENLYYEWRAKVESLKINEYISNIKEKEKITREEVAALLYSDFNKYIDTLPEKPVIILDIDNSWAKVFIKKLVFTGIIKIEKNHTFNCSKTVNRMEMASVIYNLLKKIGFKIDYGKRVYIKDIPIYHIKRRMIEKIVSLNIMKLDDNNNFDPVSALNGREILNILEKLKYILNKNEN